jgi:hypothetical protein
MTGNQLASKLAATSMLALSACDFIAWTELPNLSHVLSLTVQDPVDLAEGMFMLLQPCCLLRY